MDDRLAKRLANIEKQIEQLYAAEEKYLTLDAAKDHKLAILMEEQLNDRMLNHSSAARESRALASGEWSDFSQALAISEALFHKEKHRLDLLNNAYLAEHLSLKTEAPLIKRQA